jgi:hypothetical protein
VDNVPLVPSLTKLPVELVLKDSTETHHHHAMLVATDVPNVPMPQHAQPAKPDSNLTTTKLVIVAMPEPELKNAVSSKLPQNALQDMVSKLSEFAENATQLTLVQLAQVTRLVLHANQDLQSKLLQKNVLFVMLIVMEDAQLKELENVMPPAKLVSLLKKKTSLVLIAQNAQLPTVTNVTQPISLNVTPLNVNKDSS